MLSKNDVTVLRGMVGELLEANNHILKREIFGKMEVNNHVLKRDIRDEFHSVLKAEITGSERRMVARMDEMRTALEHRMDEGFAALNELIDDGMLPQIERNDREIARIAAHLKIA